MKRSLLILILALPALISSINAQTLSNSLGNLKSYKKSAGGITIETDNGNLKATVFSANVIRIDVTKNNAFNDFSYAVVASPVASLKFSLEESADRITISTDSMNVIITKKPVRVSLYDKGGKLVNGDDAAFGSSWIGDEITTYKKLFSSERFIGLGEKTGMIDRRGNGYENWNTDFFGYDVNADPLYSTIPFYMGLHDSLMYGLFLDNSSKTHFNFGASQDRFSSFSCDAGDMNYYLIYHSSVPKIIESYTWLTGRMSLPPIWSLGFNQCRYSYYPESELLTLAQTFRDKKIPCDVIWFDIHYMQDYKIFTWDSTRFPNPKRMLSKMNELGFKNVVIVDPGIKIEKNYSPYEDGLKNDAFLRYPDGSVYHGSVWPGACAFTDYTKPEGRIWWGSLFKKDIDDGLDGFWCDMNEPATWGQMVPDNVIFNFDGDPVTHKLGRNVYGSEMALATFEGTKKLLKGKRPFVLTRAGYAGLQRYAAIWTGDNLATDDHMMVGIRMVNSLGLSGVAFAGYDIGGFGSEASRDLFARWITVGTFCPFMRSHKAINEKESEPWSYGERVEEISRSYIQLRYNLLPYIYSTFYEATQDGLPVARSLAINYPFDEKIYRSNYANQYLFGEALLVIPCTSSKTVEQIYLPEGKWYDLYTGSLYDGYQEMYYEAPLYKLPVFVKAGSIIPAQSPIQTTAMQSGDTLFLHVYYSEKESRFIYYEDGGDGYDYEKGEFLKRIIMLDPLHSQLIIGKAEGNFSSHFKKMEIVLHGFNDLKSSVLVNGEVVILKEGEFEIASELIKSPGSGGRDAVKSALVVTSDTMDKITVQW